MKILGTILLSFLMLTACDDGSADPDGGAGGADGGMTGFPLAGTWTDEFSTGHVIDTTEWVQTNGDSASTYEILNIDTTLRQVLAHNDPANPFNPDLFSRFDWVVDGQDVFYCQAAFDKASQADAAAAAASDDSDPATSGCGGAFPWTRLLPGG